MSETTKTHYRIYSDDEILRRIGPMVPFTAAILADTLGGTHDGAYKFMRRRLEENKRPTVTNTAFGWIISNKIWMMIVPPDTWLLGATLQRMDCLE